MTLTLLGYLRHYGQLAPVVALAVLITLYAVVAGELALRRHWSLESQALDMGYADQITWSAAHGHGLRFTVFRGQVGSDLGGPLRYGSGADRDSLFAYHVELLFFPISLLYLLYPGPESLIVLLTTVLALGALPTYWIARQQLHHRGAALAFAAIYLLCPSIQAATLADFHGVSMSATLLLFAFSFLLTRRYWLCSAACLIAAATKEEVGLLIGMMGLYAWLVPRQRRFGPAVAGAAFAWVVLCFLVIIPAANGGALSPFTARYGDAYDRLRSFPRELLAGKLGLPVPDYTVSYVVHLLASTGFLALFSPLHLALAAPVLAINGLSGSPWQHGGGAHYSAEVVPALLVAAIGGTRSLAWLCWRRWKIPPERAAGAVALAGLALVLVQSQHQGILPPARRFSWDTLWSAPSPHASRLRPLLERIPPTAVVAAQSNVYPHLSNRAKLYVFPTVEDAEYILTDVVGTSDPLYPDQLFVEIQALLANPDFELLAGDDGFLLFRRLAGDAASSGAPARQPPTSFYSFALAARDERFTPLPAQFGDLFDVVGYHLDPLLEVSFASRRVKPVVYLRARRPTDRVFRFTTFIVGRDNVYHVHDDGNATQRWYPTSQWKPGELVRLSYPPIIYRAGDRLGLGAQLGLDTAEPRLPVTAEQAIILGQGRIAVLGPLP